MDTNETNNSGIKWTLAVIGLALIAAFIWIFLWGAPAVKNAKEAKEFATKAKMAVDSLTSKTGELAKMTADIKSASVKLDAATKLVNKWPNKSDSVLKAFKEEFNATFETHLKRLRKLEKTVQGDAKDTTANLKHQVIRLVAKVSDLEVVNNQLKDGQSNSQNEIAILKQQIAEQTKAANAYSDSIFRANTTIPKNLKKR